MKYDVFISYSSHDQKVVEGLCAYLEQHKIRCFVAYRDIPRGVVWARAIVEALDESRMMVVVFSGHFNNSDQVDREIELASEDKKPILTFRITDDAFKGAKKYYLKNINWIDAFPYPEQVFGRVADNVGRLLGLDLAVVKPDSVPKTTAVLSEGPAPKEAKSDKEKYDEAWAKWYAERINKRKKTYISSKTYRIGDYYDDGEKQGVVFEVSADGKHGKIVSLMESSGKLKWSSDKDKQMRLIGADDEHNGANNMEKVKQIAGWKEKYPAFAWCANLGDEWYLPAIEELEKFTLDGTTRNALNCTLQTIGVKLADRVSCHWYWSSNECNIENPSGKFCAWLVFMSDGNIDYGLKSSIGYVRAVAAF